MRGEMVELIGWLGCFLLLLAYLFLYLKRFRLFLWFNLFASFTLTVYSILLKSLPFAIVNGFITIVVLKKIVTGEKS
ncbi:hypothetical protein SAMN06265340_101217 [Desulfurobacterium atlanticum]|uniref:CBU-0592-like domain-containing protein n=2 Tax=Desulfurobacterium atlanticum TaxID=240169 RepID=A0A238XRQ7_9BACT|nr:hypothetical protein SAMN06265340_101217 [Desulfurobacterium atlanticum]